MQIGELLHETLRKTCPARMIQTPHWRCDLPEGHTGDHASIHVNRFPESATRQPA